MSHEDAHTLVLIDLQADFLKWVKNPKRVLAAATREIKYSVATGNPVVFVEYEGDGPTYRSLIRQAAAGISYRIEKTIDSAIVALHDLRLNVDLPKNFRIGGLNTDACILATIEDMSQFRFPWIGDVTVLADACDSGHGELSHLWGLEEMGHLPNIEVKSNTQDIHSNGHIQDVPRQDASLLQHPLLASL